MRQRTGLSQAIDVEVSTHDQFSGAADYARTKIGELGRYTSRPVLRARVKLTMHRDPAVQRPVVGQANLDVDGRLVRAQVQARTAREAVDLLAARLRRRLERLAAARSHERSHDSGPMQPPDYFTSRAEERRVIRRKSFTMAPCTIDEAADEMDLLDYDFHLFTEIGTGAAGVLYRAGATGFRLALVAPALADQLGSFALPVTISRQPVPCLTEEEAANRLGLLGLPFLFFIDAAHGRASVMYHRYDGDYGVITPAG